MNIIIKQPKKDELPEIASLIKETIRSSWSEKFSEGLLREFDNKYSASKFIETAKGVDYFVAKENDLIVGVIGLDGNVVENFFVKSDYQNQGVGKLLYGKVEGLAKKRKLKSIVVEASYKAIFIYEKLGFEKVKLIHKERSGYEYQNMVMIKYL